MAKSKKQNFTIEEQLVIKKALQDEFKLTEKRVSKSWLDCVDCDPDPNNPDHWDFLLYSKERNYYINLIHFPTITIEPTHTDTYSHGKIKYKKDMPVETVVWYVNNIMYE